MLVLVIFTGTGFAQSSITLTEVWSLDGGLARPESVVYDAEREVLYVSNINGETTDKDGNGYISKVDADGKMLEEQWVTGLNAPKGLALSGTLLYAADIDELVAIDVMTDDVTAHYIADGAEFLNDVTVGPDGAVYVSDMQANRIYRLYGDTLTVWLEDPNVLAPNGVYALEDELIVAAGDADAENPGAARYLRSVDYDITVGPPLGDATPLGGLDAVEPDEQGGYFLSDWGGAKVMHFVPGQGATTLLELTRGTADLDYVPEQQRLYLPVMVAGRLIAYRVEGIDP